ncbi:transcriptional regulator [Salmonella enterica]|nr:transcriptional regulator [Salmonella enterica]
MTTLTEDDVLEQLDAQNNLLSFMTTAHNILLQGIKRFLPSLFVDNDEEIVEYAVKPLLAQSGPLDDIDVALRLIYALGKMDKWLYADITHFSQFYQYLHEQDAIPGFADDITWDFISNINCITRNAPLYGALESMKFADFAAWSEVRFTGMVKTAMALAVTTILKELTP